VRAVPRAATVELPCAHARLDATAPRRTSTGRATTARSTTFSDSRAVTAAPLTVAVSDTDTGTDAVAATVTEERAVASATAWVVTHA
jgi:hypothetical protein